MKAKKPLTKSSPKTINKKNIKTKVISDKKETRGRDTKYNPLMDTIAKTLASEGRSNKQIYKVLGISEVTGISYKNKYPSFSKALDDGYKDPIKTAEEVLFKLVKGYEYDSEQIVTIGIGPGFSKVERVKVKKVIEPNLRATEYFLNNRKPRKQYPLDGYGEMLEVSGIMQYKVIPDEILEDKGE